MERKISIAIAHYNNSRFMRETLDFITKDERVSEIVIMDDCSPDINNLKNVISSINSEKIYLYENKKNLGPYHNKILAVAKCKNDWCVLLDSDNYLVDEYLTQLYKIENWDDDTIYCPDKAITFPGEPSKNLIYTNYSNKYITKDLYVKDFDDIYFQCLLNTGNFFLPCKQFFKCMQPKFSQYNRKYIECIDISIMFTDWLCEKKRIFVVNDMKYYHRLHPTSNYARGSSRQYEKSVKAQLLQRIKQI